tara:strand:+ start:13653 stop:13898 length:246 start_codon:yes stop_codon:yes gene_type:complete
MPGVLIASKPRLLSVLLTTIVIAMCDLLRGCESLHDSEQSDTLLFALWRSVMISSFEAMPQVTSDTQSIMMDTEKMALKET